MNDNEFGGGHVIAQVEVSHVKGAEGSVFGAGGVEENVDHRHRSCTGGDRVRNVASVAPSAAANSADNCGFTPLLFGDGGVGGWGFGAYKDRGDGFGFKDKFDEFNVVGVKPQKSVRTSKACLHGNGITMDIEVERAGRRIGGRGGGVEVSVCGRGNRWCCRRHTRCSRYHTRCSRCRAEASGSALRWDRESGGRWWYRWSCGKFCFVCNNPLGNFGY